MPVGFNNEPCATCGHPDYEHKASSSGPYCEWRRHGAVLGCNCTRFVSAITEEMKTLPEKEREYLACCHQVGRKPHQVSEATALLRHGRVVEIRVTIPVEGNLTFEEWLRKNFPKTGYGWVEEYLAQREVKVPTTT